MPDKIIISVRSLSKTYNLYHSHRDRMKEFFHPLRKRYHTKHDALKNVSFTVGKGEVLGVIGENGSGKSTLLKILASVVTQTSGSFECKGRVTALLELGGGFNLDLNGVENVYFLGAIQGYSKYEMSQRLQQILDFAEIGEYAYQPVKNYSSGMYVRLAFSMNININPEILIVDEALAVGDIRFQQKCFRKIREIKESGKTIVFCSHSLSAVKDFCTRAIWMHKGEIIEEGDPQLVTDKYQTFMMQKDAVVNNPVTENIENNADALPDFLKHPQFEHLKWIDLRNYQSTGTGRATIRFATFFDFESLQSITTIKGSERVGLAMVIYANEMINKPGVQLVLNGPFSAEVFNINNYHYKQLVTFEIGKPTLVVFDFTFPNISNGNYSLSLAVTDIAAGTLSYIHWIHDALMINIVNPDVRYHSGTQMVVENARIYTPEINS